MLDSLNSFVASMLPGKQLYVDIIIFNFFSVFNKSLLSYSDVFLLKL